MTTKELSASGTQEEPDQDVCKEAYEPPRIELLGDFVRVTQGPSETWKTLRFSVPAPGSDCSCGGA